MTAATHFSELDSALGTIATLSLSQRGLLFGPGRGVAAGAAAGASRVAGALVGAGLGHALGHPHEWRRRVAGRVAPQPGAPVGAEIETLAWSAETLFEHGAGAAPALAARLRHALAFHRAGNALPAVIERLHRGVPWFEAGVGSLGNGAMVRAVAAGVVLRDRPALRPSLAGLDAVVTHASIEAASVSAAVADLVAALLALPDVESDPLALLDAMLARLDEGAGHAALGLARERLIGGSPPASGALASEALAAAAWHALRHLRAPTLALESAVAALGDTDTVAALTGALVGAANGVEAFPLEWRSALPICARLEALGARIVGDGASSPSPARGRVADATGGNAVHVSFLLDRSGSMGSIAGDVIGGFNGFLRDQKAQPGSCRMTLVQFDSQDPFEVLASGVDVQAMPDLDAGRYQPRGGTPLLDATGALLDHAERRAAEHPDEDALVVVFTDGQENASGRWTREALFARIERLRARGFTFVFLGANQDSYDEGGRLGFRHGNVSNWVADEVGTGHAFHSMSRAMRSYRAKDRLHRMAHSEDFFEGIKEAETHPAARRKPN